MRLSDEFRNSLESMTASYQAALQAPVRGYLSGRGIGPDAVAYYRLGQVDASHGEHEQYAGMLCIPYLTKLGGVVSLKFRRPHECSEACEHAKYISPYDTRLYNPLAMDDADVRGILAIAEGEFDAMILDFYCGIPAVGIPGVETYKKHPEWRELFRGYSRVLIFPDDDEPNPKGERPGEELAKAISRDVDTAQVIKLPGQDVNKTFLEYGADEIRRIAGV